MSVLLELSDETGEKDFCISYLADKFKNELKTKFNSFLQNGFKYKENSKPLLKKFPYNSQKMALSFIGPKENATAVRSFARQNCNCWQELMSSKT